MARARTKKPAPKRDLREEFVSDGHQINPETAFRAGPFPALMDGIDVVGKASMTPDIAQRAQPTDVESIMAQCDDLTVALHLMSQRLAWLRGAFLVHLADGGGLFGSPAKPHLEKLGRLIRQLEQLHSSLSTHAYE